MAQRPSVQEILEAARSGSPPPPRSADAEASSPPKLAQEVPASTNPRPESSPGPGMTLQQKLAAARTASEAPTPLVRPAPTPKGDAPGRADRPRSVSEKLAAARSGAVEAPARPETAVARPSATVAVATPAEAGPDRRLFRAVATLLVGWGILAVVAGGVWGWFQRGSAGPVLKTSRTIGVGVNGPVRLRASAVPRPDLAGWVSR